MIDTSESEKTCSPVLSYFVSWSRLASGCQIITQQGRLAKLVPVKLIAANHLNLDCDILWHFRTAKTDFLFVRSLFVVRSWFDCTNTQKANLFSFHHATCSKMSDLQSWCQLDLHQRDCLLSDFWRWWTFLSAVKIGGKCILAFQIRKAFLISCNALFWA